MLFLVLVYVFYFNLFEFSAAILEKEQLGPKGLMTSLASRKFHLLRMYINNCFFGWCASGVKDKFRSREEKIV